MYTKYKRKGLTIVSVSNDRKWDDWIKALNKERMPWIQLIDEFPAENEEALVAKLFGFKTLPFYVLLNKEGKVVLASEEKEIIRKKIEKVFQ